MINNMVFDGTKVLSVDLKGDQVPTPDFESYRKDPSTAPGADLFNNPNIPKLATINMNGADAKVPVVYKANISYTHFFTDRLKVGVSGFMTLGRNNYVYVDRNMADEPFFRLAAEGNRGVYVPAESINPTNGSADWVQESTKKYIRKSFGKVAERNGGVNGFYGTFDLRIAKKFKIYKTQNIELSVDIFNVANLFSKNWGSGHNLGKQNIYSIKSFNSEQKQYVYNVNANTGVSNLNGNPYQVQIGLRYGF